MSEIVNSSIDQLREHYSKSFALGTNARCMLHIQVVEAENLLAADTNGLSDPYIKFKVDGATEKKLKTPIFNNTVNPVYNSAFSFVIKDSKLKGDILVETLDHDKANRNDSLGFTVIPLSDLQELGCLSGWFGLFKKTNMVDRRSGRFYVRMILDKDRSQLQKSKPERFEELRRGLLTLVADAERDSLNTLKSLLVEAGMPIINSNPGSSAELLPATVDPLFSNITEVPALQTPAIPLSASGALVPPVVSSITVNGNDIALPPALITPKSKAFISSPLAPLPFPPAILGDLSATAAPAPSIAHKVTFGCCSWNVGNAPPSDPALLRAWLPDTDVVAVGSQENQYAPRKGFRSHEADWEATLSAALGTDYTLVCAEGMGQIFLHVFVRAPLRRFVDVLPTDKAYEATGIANVGVNKGGCAVGLTIMGTSVAFVSAHLAAHTPHIERRNADVAEILSGIRFQGQSAGTSMLNLFSHVFFMGDLNYRLEHAGAEKEPDAVQFQEMLEHIRRDEYDALLPTDQLRREMAAERVFIGFTDAPPRFKPSFKVLRDIVGPQYTEKRAPSYCDRVLWRSMPGRAGEMRLDAFRVAHAVTSSDHKPVVATLTATLPHPLPAKDPSGGLTDVQLLVLGASAADIPVGDVDGTSDPFLKIASPYVNLGRAATSKALQNTLHPRWAREQLPTLNLALGTLERLHRLCLPVAVWDEDLTSDSALCAADLPLGMLNPAAALEAAAVGEEYVSPTVPVDLPLRSKANLPAGSLSLQVALRCVRQPPITYAQVKAMPEY